MIYWEVEKINLNSLCQIRIISYYLKLTKQNIRICIPWIMTIQFLSFKTNQNIKNECDTIKKMNAYSFDKKNVFHEDKFYRYLNALRQ